MARYLYSELASAIGAYKNCEQSGNTEWKHRHHDWIEHMQENLLPSGSGIDCGTTIDLERSHMEKLVLNTSFHHMDDNGYYDGWTEHTVTVTPSFTSGVNLRISGPNRNDIKEYLHEVFYTALTADITLEWYQYHFDNVPTVKWNQGPDGKQFWTVTYPNLDSSGNPVVLSTDSWQEARERAILWCENNRRLLKEH